MYLGNNLYNNYCDMIYFYINITYNLFLCINIAILFIENTLSKLKNTKFKYFTISSICFCDHKEVVYFALETHMDFTLFLLRRYFLITNKDNQIQVYGLK